ncbi:hypothetical protein [Occallatibacter savannae]|uniref:hypothetical protein n=1 Tax=Occallatibacter savannae TaxID=1002691 RepID=UPI0013A55946|nr:hypothetical protein [Occallatibacter savannae]
MDSEGLKMVDPKVQVLKDTVKKIERNHSDNPASSQLKQILNEKIEELETLGNREPEPTAER